MIIKKQLNIENGQINYRITDGTKNLCLLFIHGAGANSSVFQSQLRYFGSKFCSIAVDLPSHDQSTTMSYPTLEDYVNSITDVIQNEKIEQLVLAGHSMGGDICLEIYKKNPYMVKGLILISTGAYPYGITSEKYITMIKENYVQFCDFLITQFYSKYNSSAILALYKKGLLEIDKDILINDFLISDTFDYRDLLNFIKVPVLLIANRDDRVVPSKLTEDMSIKISNAQLVIFASDSHMPHIEQDKETNREIESFIIKNFSR